MAIFPSRQCWMSADFLLLPQCGKGKQAPCGKAANPEAGNPKAGSKECSHLCRRRHGLLPRRSLAYEMAQVHPYINLFTCSCSKGIEFLGANDSAGCAVQSKLSKAQRHMIHGQTHSSDCMCYNPCRTLMPMNREMLILLEFFFERDNQYHNPMLQPSPM